MAHTLPADSAGITLELPQPQAYPNDSWPRQADDTRHVSLANVESTPLGHKPIIL